MRKSRTLSILLMTMFLLPFAVSALSLDWNEQIEPLYDLDIEVETRGYTYYGRYCVEESFLYIEFEVVSGGDIDFYLFDEENFLDWEDDHDATSIYHYPNCESLERNFTIEYADYYYALFVNWDYSTTKHIVGSVLGPESTTTSVPPTPDIGIFVLAGLCVALVIGGICWKLRKKQAVRPVRYSPQPLHSISDHSAQQGPVTTQSLCPFCGKFGALLQSRYCPSCGRDIGVPPTTT